jgi:hypothetical protein
MYHDTSPPEKPTFRSRLLDLRSASCVPRPRRSSLSRLGRRDFGKKDGLTVLSMLGWSHGPLPARSKLSWRRPMREALQILLTVCLVVMLGYLAMEIVNAL